MNHAAIEMHVVDVTRAGISPVEWVCGVYKSTNAGDAKRVAKLLAQSANGSWRVRTIPYEPLSKDGDA